MRARVGDTLVVEGDQARTGLIIGVPHADGSPPYIVKWLAGGHIAMMSPDDFARVIPAAVPADPAPEDSRAGSSGRASEQGSDVIGHERL
jgi:hypothetical protein